jgi:rhodanese-related sulfurtransferase
MDLDPREAHLHFARRLAVETDAADVAAAMASGGPELVLIDARSPEAYAAAHLPGAISLPHATIDEATVAELPDGPVVAYCWGPGCNAATKAGAKLAALGRHVKEMLGGFEYWVREGHPLEGDSPPNGAYRRDPDSRTAWPSRSSSS